MLFYFVDKVFSRVQYPVPPKKNDSLNVSCTDGDKPVHKASSKPNKDDSKTVKKKEPRQHKSDRVYANMRGDKESRWNKRYNELVEYKRQTGHCKVPKRFKANQALGCWVVNQRTKLKKGKMSEDKTAKLEEIGFMSDITSRSSLPGNDLGGA